jgi:nicotinamidase-related amidase
MGELMNATTPTIDPQRAILLVMDCQPAIVNGLPGADGLLSRLAGAIALARRNGMRVAYIRVAFDETDYDAIPRANKAFAGAAGGRRLSNDAPESAIHDAVSPEPGDLVVRKTRVGAFSTTDLDKQLRDRQIDTLVLAGVSTSGVVLSTVRDAADRDYQLYVLEDGCADRDPEVHDLLMRKVFPRQTWVVSIADLPALLTAE